MGGIWASDGDEWGDPTTLQTRNSSEGPRMASCAPRHIGNTEGESGTPSSYIDVDDPRMARMFNAEKRERRSNFKENIGLVSKMIQYGIVYPTADMISRTVDMLKRIARG